MVDFEMYAVRMWYCCLSLFSRAYFIADIQIAEYRANIFPHTSVCQSEISVSGNLISSVSSILWAQTELIAFQRQLRQQFLDQEILKNKLSNLISNRD